MGTGYVRNDTSNNIADGNIINAADLDGEFDAIESAFGTSGHTHDGTSAEGGPVTVLGPTQDFVASATEIKPKTTNTLDIGTSGLLFKDMYLDGVATLGSIKIDNGGAIGSASDADAIVISSGGVVTFSQAPLVDVTNATTNAVTDVLGIRVQSTGTPAVGIGSGLTLGVETASGNIETGGALRIVSTGLTPTDEEIDLVFYSMRNGSLTEAFRFDSDTDSLRVEDNVKVTFGAGQDLQIYHTGSYSLIADTSGTGPLRVVTNTFQLNNAADTENMINAAEGGAVTLYNAGAAKLATTSTGIDVTGTVTADGLTVDGDVVANGTGDVNGAVLTVDDAGTLGLEIQSGSPTLLFKEDDTTNENYQIRLSSGDLLFQTQNDARNSAATKMTLDASGNVGIGTTSPTDKLNITGGGASIEGSVSGFTGGEVLLGNTTANTQSAISTVATGTPQMYFDHRGTSTGQWVWRSSSSERMRIDSSGNVGIGTSSPSYKLQLSNSTDTDLAIIAGKNSGDFASVVFGDTDYPAEGRITYQNSDDAMRFWANRNQAMMIDSSGNLIVGATSAVGDIHGQRSDGAMLWLGRTTNSGQTTALLGEIRFGDTAFDSNLAAIQSNLDGNTTSSNLSFYTQATGSSSAERMRIDSSGNVGIGTSSPSSYNSAADNLVVGTTSGENGITIASGTTNQGSIFFADGTSGGAVADGYLIYVHGSNYMAMGTGNAERMRIDSSGNVGIGTSSPAAAFLTGNSLDVNGPVFVRGVINAHQTNAGVLEYSADETRIRSYGATSGSGKIIFSTGGGGSADTEAMRTDSSGNLLVGKTTTSSSTQGILLEGGTGQVVATATSNFALYANRLSTDGELIRLQKDGTTVGSIGAASDYLYIYSPKATGGAGIGLGNSWIYPCNSTGSISDATFDLGISNARYKDLYLSGGVYLGGTASGNPSNKLDDYEAGDFNAALTSASGSISVDASYNKMLYTKVGRLVTITGRIRIGSVSSASGAFYLTLPFTSINFAEEADFAILNLLTYNVDLDANVVSTFGEVNPNSTECYAYQQRDNNTWIVLDASGLSAGDILYFSGTYVAA